MLYVQCSKSLQVSIFTGLDPAGPLFESQDPRARLDKTDANFVDVIHSNGEQLLLGGLGSWQPMGDVDFYPNGGRMQTGCSNLFLGAVSDIIWCKYFLNPYLWIYNDVTVNYNDIYKNIII